MGCKQMGAGFTNQPTEVVVEGERGSEGAGRADQGGEGLAGKQGGDLPNAGESSAVWRKKTKWGERRISSSTSSQSPSSRQNHIINEPSFNPCFPVAMYENLKWISFTKTPILDHQKPMSVKKTWPHFYLQPLCKLHFFQWVLGGAIKLVDRRNVHLECLVHFSSPAVLNAGLHFSALVGFRLSCCQ